MSLTHCPYCMAPVKPGELLPMLRPLFGALEAMHSQGLTRRDGGDE